MEVKRGVGVWVWRFPVFLGGGQVFFIRIWGYFAQLRGGFKDLFTPHPLLLPRAPQRTPPPPHPNQAPKDPPGTLPGASICTATSVRPSSPCWVSTKTTQKPPEFTTFLLFTPIPTPKMVKIHHLFKEKKKKRLKNHPITLLLFLLQRTAWCRSSSPQTSAIGFLIK